EARIAQSGDRSVRFVGPVFGDQKAQLLADAHLVCLPSHSEGLPMTILEAWASGTPTLMTRHCHVDIGFARGAAIETGTAPAEIADALRKVLAASPEAWRAMARSAAMLAEEQFSPAAIKARWRAIYAKLLTEKVEGASP
ncbi:MAG: hypothetical protein H6R45_898, partial [Proteobacteria bacterium]|nr:hypothetical protein [Pseudomonadota bacterium]